MNTCMFCDTKPKYYVSFKLERTDKGIGHKHVNLACAEHLEDAIAHAVSLQGNPAVLVESIEGREAWKKANFHAHYGVTMEDLSAQSELIATTMSCIRRMDDAVTGHVEYMVSVNETPDARIKMTLRFTSAWQDTIIIDIKDWSTVKTAVVERLGYFAIRTAEITSEEATFAVHSYMQDRLTLNLRKGEDRWRFGAFGLTVRDKSGNKTSLVDLMVDKMFNKNSPAVAEELAQMSQDFQKNYEGTFPVRQFPGDIPVSRHMGCSMGYEVKKEDEE